MLAVIGEERSAAFPEVPTIKEQGLPNLVVRTWTACSRRPAAGRDRNEAEHRVSALLGQAEVRETLARRT